MLLERDFPLERYELYHYEPVWHAAEEWEEQGYWTHRYADEWRDKSYRDGHWRDSRHQRRVAELHSVVVELCSMLESEREKLRKSRLEVRRLKGAR